MKVIEAFNLKFTGLGKEEILQKIREGYFQVVLTINAEFIVLANENQRFKEVLNKYTTTIDGQIPYFLLKMKYKNIYFEKISGSEFIYDVCSVANELGLKVFLLGGLEESNILAQKKLKEMYPNIKINGYSPPYSPYPFSKEHNENIINKIKSFSPDILFVAFGAPKQEFWIDDNINYIKEIGIRFVMGVGGTFEMISGKEKPAPKIIKKIGLESIWRLSQNQKRIKRFFKNFKIFKYWRY